MREYFPHLQDSRCINSIVFVIRIFFKIRTLVCPYIIARFDFESWEQAVKVAGFKLLNFLFSINDQRKCRRLNAPNCGHFAQPTHLECDGACPVYANQPICFRTTAGSILQSEHIIPNARIFNALRIADWVIESIHMRLTGLLQPASS